MFFCFRQDWPTGPVDRRLCLDVHVCACPSVDRRVDRLRAGLLSGFLGRPPGRPTESRFALGFSGSTARSTTRRKLCFYLEDGLPSGRPEPNGSLPAVQTVDRPGRPPSLQSAQWLFPLWCNLKSVFFF